MNIFCFSRDEIVSQSDDRIPQERRDDFLISSRRMMPFKPMIALVLGEISLGGMNNTAHPIRNLLAHLNKLFLTSAIFFSKISESIFRRRKSIFAVQVNIHICRVRTRLTPNWKIKWISFGFFR
jgi:hypothetical protein